MVGQGLAAGNLSIILIIFVQAICALYHKNPVRIDIAGTVESIAQINADLLYRCYNTFYNLHNMALTVAGNFTVGEVLAVADRVLGESGKVTIENFRENEPDSVKERYVEQKLAVATPLFNIGFKGRARSRKENVLNSLVSFKSVFLSSKSHVPAVLHNHIKVLSCCSCLSAASVNISLSISKSD